MTTEISADKSVHPRVLEEEISLQEFFSSLWAGRWVVVGTTLFFGALAMAGAVVIPEKYEARTRILLVSNTSGSGGSLGGLASQLGGLASLVGIGSSDTNRAESLAVLESNNLSRRFIEANNLLPELFPDRWDSSGNSWKIDGSPPPSLTAGSDHFLDKVVTIEEDGKTGLVTVSMLWTEPEAAASWANNYVSLANEMQRDRAITKSERNIAYLNDQVGRTNVVEQRQAIFNLVQAELQQIMLAKGNDEYAYRVIDEAIPSLKPSFPNPILWTVVGLMTGLLLSSTYVFARTALSRVH